MCGPTDAESTMQQNQIDFYNRLSAQDTAVFGEDQNILNQLQSVYQPILARGPNQYGFSPDQENVLKTTAAQSIGTNYQQATRALTEKQAALGGGNTYLPSGVTVQQQANLAAAAAQQRSSSNLAIKQAGYQQGYQQFQDATRAMTNASQLLNPTSYAGVSNTASANAAETAEKLAAQQTSWVAPVLGAVGAVGGAALGNYGAALGAARGATNAMISPKSAADV